MSEAVSMQDDRPNVKFLTVVWGKVYIERFCDLSLPSFLAPGNIPALSKRVNLEVVIMTRKGDFSIFEQHSAYRNLTAHCNVRFVEIDDLVSHGVYGVTLTLAYARPIIQCGKEMLNTFFLFMNADFILADGSLMGLYKHIHDGRSIVLGPSFRAIAEAVEPKLRDELQKEACVLSMPPRDMVRISMAHPHSTTSAKIINQKVLHSTHPNQFFWQVDSNTMLGRYFLIFMLCLKPEKVITSVNSYCDYAFIPEMCPSGDEVAMGDSDDFFMLELQNRDQELYMLRAGGQTDTKTARSLQEWTTAEHRRASSYDIVFHSGDLPPDINAVREQAKSYIDHIKSMLSKPKEHAGHVYWRYGVEKWKEGLEEKGLPTEVLELKSSTIDAVIVSRRVQRWLTKRLYKYFSKHKYIRKYYSLFSGVSNADEGVMLDIIETNNLAQSTLAIVHETLGEDMAQRDAYTYHIKPHEIEANNVSVDMPGDHSVHNMILILEAHDVDEATEFIEKCVAYVQSEGCLYIVLKENSIMFPLHQHNIKTAVFHSYETLSSHVSRSDLLLKAEKHRPLSRRYIASVLSRIRSINPLTQLVFILISVLIIPMLVLLDVLISGFRDMDDELRLENFHRVVIAAQLR